MSSRNTLPLTRVIPNVTLADVYHNADILGYSRIHYAEKLGFAHEYDVILRDAITQEKRYLLLKQLVDAKLTDTNVCKKVVSAIAENVENVREFITLHFSIAFDDTLTALVAKVKKERDFTPASRYCS